MNCQNVEQCFGSPHWFCAWLVATGALRWLPTVGARAVPPDVAMAVNKGVDLQLARPLASTHSPPSPQPHHRDHTAPQATTARITLLKGQRCREAKVLYEYNSIHFRGSPFRAHKWRCMGFLLPPPFADAREVAAKSEGRVTPE